VLALLRGQRREEHGVEALELVATEEEVALGICSPQPQEVGSVPIGGQIFQVFALRNGVIVRVDEHERRGITLAVARPKAGTTDASVWGRITSPAPSHVRQVLVRSHRSLTHQETLFYT
jgi:hypothetical protein